MPRLTPIHCKKLIKIFEADGWKYNRTKGDHFVYVKKGFKRPIVIPLRKDVAVHIVKRNMDTAEMARERYFELLKKA